MKQTRSARPPPSDPSHDFAKVETETDLLLVDWTRLWGKWTAAWHQHIPLQSVTVGCCEALVWWISRKYSSDQWNIHNSHESMDFQSLNDFRIHHGFHHQPWIDWIIIDGINSNSKPSSKKISSQIPYVLNLSVSICEGALSNCINSIVVWARLPTIDQNSSRSSQGSPTHQGQQPNEGPQPSNGVCMHMLSMLRNPSSACELRHPRCTAMHRCLMMVIGLYYANMWHLCCTWITSNMFVIYVNFISVHINLYHAGMYDISFDM